MNNSQVTSLLLERLERIPADSIWAHKASGLRGSLIKTLQELEADEAVNPLTLEWLHHMSFHVLEQAAREKLRHSGSEL